MDIKDRIKQIMEKEHMMAGNFADSIGVQQSTLSHVINGRNRPSLDVVRKIHQRYNYVNLEWLLHGTGEMMGKTDYSGHNPLPLFGQNQENEDVGPEDFKNRKPAPVETPISDPKPAVIQEIKYIERPPRKITEIRIFFDDNTYETFKGEK
jgi:transcriptional regulator with XRE-family HTH domain